MDPEILEALQRRYLNDVRIILQLSSGRWVCYNNAREICKIADTLQEAVNGWFAPRQPALAKESNDENDILSAAGL